MHIEQSEQNKQNLRLTAIVVPIVVTEYSRYEHQSIQADRTEASLTNRPATPPPPPPPPSNSKQPLTTAGKSPFKKKDSSASVSSNLHSIQTPSQTAAVKSRNSSLQAAVSQSPIEVTSFLLSSPLYLYLYPPATIIQSRRMRDREREREGEGPVRWWWW